MRIEHFLAIDSNASGAIGRPSSGNVGAPVGCEECSSGWYLFGGLVLGIAGTLATQAFGPMIAASAKTGLKRRAANW